MARTSRRIRRHRRRAGRTQGIEALETRVLLAGEAVINESVFDVHQFKQNIEDSFRNESVVMATIVPRPAAGRNRHSMDMSRTVCTHSVSRGARRARPATDGAVDATQLANGNVAHLRRRGPSQGASPSTVRLGMAIRTKRTAEAVPRSEDRFALVGHS